MNISHLRILSIGTQMHHSKGNPELVWSVGHRKHSVNAQTLHLEAGKSGFVMSIKSFGRRSTQRCKTRKKRGPKLLTLYAVACVAYSLIVCWSWGVSPLTGYTGQGMRREYTKKYVRWLRSTLSTPSITYNRSLHWDASNFITIILYSQ